MASSKNKTTYLHVSVQWGGHEIGGYHRRLNACRGLKAGSGFFCDIRSGVWPRLDELEILVKSRSGLILNPNLPWDGVVSSGQDTVFLNSLRPQRRLIEIKSSTSASLRLDELTVAIRVGPRIVAKPDRIKMKSGYMASPLAFIAHGSTEWGALWLALIGSAIITGSAAWSLAVRKSESYLKISDLPEERLLPFISQKHLADAPNIIQAGLDRFNYIHSVWNFYTDLTSSLGFGDSIKKSDQIFETTSDYYKNLAAAQEKYLSGAENAQTLQIRKLSPDRSILSVPSVQGETLDGKALRIFDKISILTRSSGELFERRNEVVEKFVADIGYKFEERKSPDTTSAAFAKISEGFLGVESDDKMQAKQAKESAARATLAQMTLFGEEQLKLGPTACCSAPAGIPLTQEGLIWLAAAFDAQSAKPLSGLKASKWGHSTGAEKPNIREPLAGHMNPADVERTVNAGRYQLRLCYELALRRNQNATGSMEWRWLIDSTGRISDINLLDTSIRDDDLIRCIRDKIAHWRFPKPSGGSVEVSYPFEFSKDKG